MIKMVNKPKLFKNILDYSLLALMGIFIISLIFVPLNYFSSYGKWIITLGIVVFLISIAADLFYFAKETPSRRWGKHKHQDTRKIWGIKRKTFITIIEIVGVIFVLLIILGFKKGSIGSAECPDVIEGNPKADFRIKYFYSPFCPYCWKEEPILKEIVDEYGDSFSLERYDIRYCDKEVNKYKVVGTPNFVFGKKNEDKEFKRVGFLTKEELEKIILTQTEDVK